MSRVNQSQALGVEVEHEKETLKEAEKETMKEAMCFDPTLKEKARHAWAGSEGASCLSSFITQGTTPYMRPLNAATQTYPLFLENLFVDDNFAQVYEGQERLLCPYLKPVEAILFRMKGESLTACLIDMEDLAELNGLIHDDGETKVWISTTQHTILSGTLPDGVLQNGDYQSLIEQIRVFNGELNGLREQEAPLCWLDTDANNKLDYFQEHIMPYRQTTASEFKALQATLNRAPLAEVGVKDTISVHEGASMRFFKTKSPDVILEPSSVFVKRPV